MQLCEQGVAVLDASASDYLRSVRLIPAKASCRPATVRHLLTHTAGIGYWRRLSDLLQPGVGSGVRAGRRPVPPLPDYSRQGLRVEVEPGTKWVYSKSWVRRLGPDRRGRDRPAPRPVPARPHLRAVGDGAHRPPAV